MKLWKKIAVLGTVMTISLGCGIWAGCDDDSSDSSSSSSSFVEATDYVYKVSVQSTGGFGHRNVYVTLMDGTTEIATAVTNQNGNAIFTETDVAQKGEYDVVLSELPAGWSLANQDATYTTSKTGSDLVVSLAPHLLEGEQLPANNYYSLGEVMYDFTVTTSDGNAWSLYDVLETHDAVVLNFWYDGCSWCFKEFPYMVQAYNSVYATTAENADVLYSDKIAILGISPYDDNEEIESYKTRYKSEFDLSTIDMAYDSVNLTGMFDVSAMPTSVMIDRYGVICEIESGAILSRKAFTDWFEQFIGEDYEQTIVGAGSEEESGGDEELAFAPSEVANPDITKVNDILNKNHTNLFSAYWTDEETSWPWLIGSDENGDYLYSSNSEVDYSYATLSMNFDVTADKVLAFDCYVSAEDGGVGSLYGDNFYILIDGVIIHKLTGAVDSWQTCYAYVFESAQSGVTLDLLYQKDSSTSVGEDVIKLRNFRILDKDVLNADDIDVNIFRYAATGKATETTAFSDYITPVYNTADGYYHVNSADGPLLLADIMDNTQWNVYDLWQLAYNDRLIYKGHNFSALVEDYAWAETNASDSFVPVSQDLKDLLVYISKIEGLPGEASTKAWHENEWLEMCAYYDHYGNTPAMDDPTRGITYDGAIEIVEGTNEISCNVSLVPLGIKHKFTPEKSGVYRFHSLFDAKYEDTDSSYDPQCWIVAPDRETFLAYNDDSLLNENIDNFDIYVYLEKDKTYYALFAFFLNSTGKMNVEIEYMGEDHTYLTNAAVGPYSFNEVTNEYYLPDASRYVLADFDKDGDKEYCVVDKNGNLISKLYLDMINGTPLFPSNSFKQIIESANSYDVNKRLFYLDDGNGGKKDYTSVMRKYLQTAKLTTGELYGLVEIDEELMDILVKLTKAHDGFGGIKNSWQLACYCYCTIDANNPYQEGTV